MSEEETTKGAKKGAKVEKGAPIEHTHPPKKKEKNINVVHMTSVIVEINIETKHGNFSCQR